MSDLGLRPKKEIISDLELESYEKKVFNEEKNEIAKGPVVYAGIQVNKKEAANLIIQFFLKLTSKGLTLTWKSV